MKNDMSTSNIIDPNEDSISISKDQIRYSKKWIDIIRESYPERKDEVIEDLLNTFRGSLYPRSKEKYRLIVGILLLNDVMLFAHCKKDPSLAEWEDKIYSVKLILHPNLLLSIAESGVRATQSFGVLNLRM